MDRLTADALIHYFCSVLVGWWWLRQLHTLHGNHWRRPSVQIRSLGYEFVPTTIPWVRIRTHDDPLGTNSYLRWSLGYEFVPTMISLGTNSYRRWSIGYEFVLSSLLCEDADWQCRMTTEYDCLLQWSLWIVRSGLIRSEKVLRSQKGGKWIQNWRLSWEACRT